MRPLVLSKRAPLLPIVCFHDAAGSATLYDEVAPDQLLASTFSDSGQGGGRPGRAGPRTGGGGEGGWGVQRKNGPAQVVDAV